MHTSVPQLRVKLDLNLIFPLISICYAPNNVVLNTMLFGAPGQLHLLARIDMVLHLRVGAIITSHFGAQIVGKFGLPD